MEVEAAAAIERLVGMGFAADSAAKALAAAGGDIHKATDWLLNHPQSPPSPMPMPESAPPPNIQPKINRFFNPNTRNDLNPPKTLRQSQEIERNEQSPYLIYQKKRPRSPETQRNSPIAAAEAAAPPLSERMRPRVVDEVVGQDHLLSGESLLRSAVAQGRLPSFILWGPPGTGKTSIARAIVTSSYRFVSLSAVTCGVKEVRDAVEAARRSTRKRTVLFLDEVHRFNKAQQDSFLPVIEDGTIVFVGATTENPSFHLITPLLSRCRVLTLNPLNPHHITTLLNRAASDAHRGLLSALKSTTITTLKVDDSAVDFLSLHCDGDARVALNALETAATTAAARITDESHLLITLDDVKEALQSKHVAYDRAGEEHYNLISALHKSMRGSHADAALYWLARMLEGGETPLYIARRLVRFASEDVGLADSQALTHAVSCYQACHFIGMPECNVVLAHCVAYLALAPKSVAVYRAIKAAQKVVKESVGQNERVPLHLRNAPTKLMKDLGYGDGYVYPPDDEGGEASSMQTYLPPSLQDSRSTNSFNNADEMGSVSSIAITPPYQTPQNHPPLCIYPPPTQPSVGLPPPMRPPIPPSPYTKPDHVAWCVAKATVSASALQTALDYACASGADCGPIQVGGACFQPDTVVAHSSFAFNSYWQKNKLGGGTCDFGGTATIVTVDPSYDQCHFLVT